VPSNLAEGADRESKKEFARFVHIARGLLNEMDTQLSVRRSLPKGASTLDAKR
jgi:four helix bundle protein